MLALTRTEGLVLAIVLSGLELWRRRTILPWAMKLIVPIVLLLGPWLVFLSASVLLAIGILAFLAIISRLVLNRNFFNASFSEGNSLSTLDLSVSETVDVLDQSEFLKSKRYESGVVNYILVSRKFEDLKTIMAGFEKDSRVQSYQLNQ